MRTSLILHPDSRCSAVARLDVEVNQSRDGGLVLHYVVTGAIGDLLLPPLAMPARADGLWRHTCFEAFVRALPGQAYDELNLAPSTAWAAYHFDRYREGMRISHEIETPRLQVNVSAGRFELHAALAWFPPVNGPRRLGLSAVIEETNGTKSYWALAHPPGPPDFHHSDCFALDLPAAWPS